VKQIIDQFNALSSLVTASILDCNDIDSRVELMAKVIRIADLFRSYHNYHGLMAVLSGVEQACITRLTRTFQMLQEQYKKEFQIFNSLKVHQCLIFKSYSHLNRCVYLIDADVS
jgi:hypothetical protein